MEYHTEVLYSPVLASDEIIVCHFATDCWRKMTINQLMSSQLLSDDVSERRGETKKVTRKRDISQGKIQWSRFVWHSYDTF